MAGQPQGQSVASVLNAIKTQIDWCERLGSPFTARVLTLLAKDIAAGGVAATLVDAWPGDPVADALPLRLTGALHALVLNASAPDLAASYPSQGTARPELSQSTLSAALATHQNFIRGFLASPPQTNEVGRAAVLLGGFLQIAEESRLPLRLLEIGASAGLNMVWDRYHYRLGAGAWGDPRSAVRLSPQWQGPVPPLDAPLRVAARRACDIAPIDIGDAAQRLRLRAYVWADQHDRLSRLEGAIAVARDAGYAVERADAAAWVKTELERPAPDCMTVLYHSIVWQYLPEPTQSAVMDTLRSAGAQATASAPLAWLRFEPPRPDTPSELRLTLWPGGTDRCLATAHPHGSAVTWSDS